jgi:RND family efflux transporter MFP subunit
MIKSHTPILLLLCLLLTNPLQAKDGHEKLEDTSVKEDASEHASEEESGIRLNTEQRRIAGIIVEEITAEPIVVEIEAPGEILLNSYATHQLTPRIEAQVIERHARLGDKVNKGQLLVTLSSVTMSEAQGQLLVAENEWQRVRKLGREVVSARRYQDARIAAQQARASLSAYGMTQSQIDQLASSDTIENANGRFGLFAPLSGTVIRDDFITGQMAQVGSLLFEISDETTLWVEAKLAPGSANSIQVGNPAQIMIDGNWMPGKVIQVHHTLDETTRTLAVRLEVSNPNDRLHTGQFVTARIQNGRSEERGMVLPLNALLRSADGDWQVFVEHEPGEFEPKEVEIVRHMGGRVQIEGLESGSRVVTQGAFFVQSELAKSGFAVHNH